MNIIDYSCIQYYSCFRLYCLFRLIKSLDILCQKETWFWHGYSQLKYLTYFQWFIYLFLRKYQTLPDTPFALAAPSLPLVCTFSPTCATFAMCWAPKSSTDGESQFLGQENTNAIKMVGALLAMPPWKQGPTSQHIGVFLWQLSQDDSLSKGYTFLCATIIQDYLDYSSAYTNIFCL